MGTVLATTHNGNNSAASASASGFCFSLLVALYGGDKPTNGYTISIARVTELDTDVRIDYRVAGSGGPIPSVTQPFAILKLQKPIRGISIRRIN